jgi:hypothetical protein
MSQIVVATGPLFFLLATPEQPWFIVGAFLVWIAYAGLNVGLDNIKLKLAPAENNSPFVAVYHAVGDLANGLTTLAGGAILDVLTARGSQAGSLYIELFVAGFVSRVLAVPLLAWLIEPGARPVREMALAVPANAIRERGGRPSPRDGARTPGSLGGFVAGFGQSLAEIAVAMVDVRYALFADIPQ